jgi:hypothetical protein
MCRQPRGIRRVETEFTGCELELDKTMSARLCAKVFCLCLQFKEEFNTEKKIAANLKPRDESPDWLIQEAEETKKGLFKLMSVSAPVLYW